jgi:hypothetical protein
MDSAGKRARGVPARQGDAPWCLPVVVSSSPERRKASATPSYPLRRGPSHHLENPCIVLVDVGEGTAEETPQAEETTPYRAWPASGQPSFPLGLSLPPLQRQRATPYNASAPAFSYLRAAGRGRALVWMRCRWVLAGRHDKRRPGRGRKEAAARGKAILLAKAKAGSGQWQCMHV